MVYCVFLSWFSCKHPYYLARLIVASDCYETPDEEYCEDIIHFLPDATVVIDNEGTVV